MIRAEIQTKHKEYAARMQALKEEIEQVQLAWC